jgi:hypothetical protein
MRMNAATNARIAVVKSETSMSARAVPRAHPQANAVINPTAHAQRERNVRAAAMRMNAATNARIAVVKSETSMSARAAPRAHPQANGVIDPIAHAQRERNAPAVVMRMNVATSAAPRAHLQADTVIDPIGVVRKMIAATSAHAANRVQPPAATQKIVRSARAVIVLPLEDRASHAAHAVETMIAVNVRAAQVAANRANRNRNEIGKSQGRVANLRAPFNSTRTYHEKHTIKKRTTLMYTPPLCRRSMLL